jgi:hypothetical protein
MHKIEGAQSQFVFGHIYGRKFDTGDLGCQVRSG